MFRCDCCQHPSQLPMHTCNSALGGFSLMYCDECYVGQTEPKNLIEQLINDVGGMRHLSESINPRVTIFINGHRVKVAVHYK